MEELDDLIAEARRPILRRWLRETDAIYADIHAGNSHKKALVEARAKRIVHEGDRMIADLRRRRRSFGLTRDQVETFDFAIESIEREQQRVEQWLADQLRILRQAYAEAEEASLRVSRPWVTMEMNYCINWRDTTGPAAATQALIDEFIAATRYFGPLPPKRHNPHSPASEHGAEERTDSVGEPSTETLPEHPADLLPAMPVTLKDHVNAPLQAEWLRMFDRDL